MDINRNILPKIYESTPEILVTLSKNLKNTQIITAFPINFLSLEMTKRGREREREKERERERERERKRERDRERENCSLFH